VCLSSFLSGLSDVVIVRGGRLMRLCWWLVEWWLLAVGWGCWVGVILGDPRRAGEIVGGVVSWEGSGCSGGICARCVLLQN
jgi:hypothetical protein